MLSFLHRCLKETKGQLSRFGYSRDGTITFTFGEQIIDIGIYVDSGLRLHPENWRDVSDNGKTLTRGMKVDILDAAVAYFYGRGSTLEMEILAEDPDADLLTAAAARYDKTRLQLLFSSQTARRAELRQQILTRMKEGFAVTVLDTPVTSEHEVNKILKEYDHRAANEKSPQPFHWRYRRTTSPEMH